MYKVHKVKLFWRKQIINRVQEPVHVCYCISSSEKEINLELLQNPNRNSLKLKFALFSDISWMVLPMQLILPSKPCFNWSLVCIDTTVHDSFLLLILEIKVWFYPYKAITFRSFSNIVFYKIKNRVRITWWTLTVSDDSLKWHHF